MSYDRRTAAAPPATIRAIQSQYAGRLASLAEKLSEISTELDKETANIEGNLRLDPITRQVFDEHALAELLKAMNKGASNAKWLSMEMRNRSLYKRA